METAFSWTTTAKMCLSLLMTLALALLLNANNLNVCFNTDTISFTSVITSLISYRRDRNINYMTHINISAYPFSAGHNT